jgi:hypothetical protein
MSCHSTLHINGSKKHSGKRAALIAVGVHVIVKQFYIQLFSEKELLINSKA